MKVKYKYLLFSYDDFYPQGGTNDLDFGFNKIEDIDFEDNEFYCSDNINVLDLETMETHKLSVYNNTPSFESLGSDEDKYDEAKKEIVKKWLLERFN